MTVPLLLDDKLPEGRDLCLLHCVPSCLGVERWWDEGPRGLVRGGKDVAVTSIATATSGEHSSQVLRSCSTFRRTWGLILRSRFSPNFCSFARIFLAGRKFFRSSGSLDRRSKYLGFQEERASQEAAGRWGWHLRSSISLCLSCDASRAA